MDTPRLGCIYTLLGLFLAMVLAGAFGKLAQFHPNAGWIGAGAIAFFLIAGLVWKYHPYIAFSLRTLFVVILSLQFPLALIVGGWDYPEPRMWGFVALMVWAGCVGMYLCDQILARWVRRQSLQKLERERFKDEAR